MSFRNSPIRSDVSALLSKLKACISPRDLEKGRKIHADAKKKGNDLDIFVAISLVRMYTKCGSMADARQVFDNVPQHDVALHNALIQGYAENGQGEMALELFESFQQQFTPTSRSFVAAVKACIALAAKEDVKQVDGRLVKVESLGKGMAIHDQAEKLGFIRNIYVRNSLISLYTKCGSLVNARRVFDSMTQRDIISWTALIIGYVENGEPEMGLRLFATMQIQRDCKPDSTIFVAALNACTSLAGKEEGKLLDGNALMLKSLEQGMCIHSEARKFGYDFSNVFVANSLINMYAKCGSMLDARGTFDRMQYHDVVSWNSLMLGYVENSQGEMAWSLVPWMDCEVQALSFVIAVKACSAVAISEEGKQIDGKLIKVEALEKGMTIHSQARKLGYDKDIVVTNALVDMYAKCGSLVDARRIFNGMSLHSLVSWTSLMVGYAENGEADQALELFALVRDKDCDVRAYLAALKACGSVVSLEIASAIHSDILRTGMDKFLALDTGLVDVYGKCGSLDCAHRVFDAISSNDSVTWTALLTGYGRQGDTSQVFQLFYRMKEEGRLPNSVTFLCLLTACSHAGLVDKGWKYFQAMNSRYSVSPGIEHYHCMLDILGRANRLEDAMEMARTMPFKPNQVTWITILGACRKWKNTVVGRIAFEALVELDAGEKAVYTLMSGIYGAMGMWEEQAKILEAMRKNGRAWKKPGRSWWTDATGSIHRFLAGDTAHPQIEEIRAKLAQVLVKMKEHGYIADTGCVIHNIAEAEKEDALCGHSERLAIGCALINTAPGTTIRITKNLRVCEDCHRATAVISKVEGRVIVCRDSSRFHVFEAGRCLCGDYW